MGRLDGYMLVAAADSAFPNDLPTLAFPFPHLRDIWSAGTLIGIGNVTVVVQKCVCVCTDI